MNRNRFVFLVSFLALSGCGQPSPQGAPIGGPCMKAGDCQSNACSSNVCVATVSTDDMAGPGTQCVTENDCSTGRLCENGWCVSRPDLSMPDMAQNTGACMPSEMDPLCASAASCKCEMTANMQDECSNDPAMCMALPPDYNTCAPGHNTCGFDLYKSLSYSSFNFYDAFVHHKWIGNGGTASSPHDISYENGQLRVGLDAITVGVKSDWWTCGGGAGDRCWQACKATPTVTCYSLRFKNDGQQADVEVYDHAPSDLKPDRVVQTIIQGQTI